MTGSRVVGTPFQVEQARPPSSRRGIRLLTYGLLAFGDFVSLVIAFLLGNFVRFGTIYDPSGIVSLVVMLPIFFGVIAQRKPYSGRFFISWRRSARDAITALVTSIAVAGFVAFYLHANLDISRSVVLIAGCLAAVLLVGGRWLLSQVVMAVVHGQPVATLMIVDGVDIAVPNVARVSADSVNLSPRRADPADFARLNAVVGSCERVVIACPPDRRADWAALLKGANVMCEIVTPELDGLGMIRSSSLVGMSTIVTSLGPLDTMNRAVKRAFDLAVATVALVLLAPLLIVVAIAIQIDSAGPVFFRQPRMGRNNLLFDVLKFRSMRTDQCDTAGDRSTERGDPRITRVGRVIRATSIDELPQLFNVLNGAMSIVGPRPHALGSLAGDKLFWEVDDQYWDRHAMKPGITGLAQVHGYRGATEAPEDLTKRLRADIAYMRDWSIWRDLRILAATVRVIFHRNAY